MIVRLKGEWMGNPIGHLIELNEIKANELVKRGVAEAVTRDQAKAEMEKRQKMQRDFKDKMVDTSKKLDKEPENEPEKEPGKDPDKPGAKVSRLPR